MTITMKHDSRRKFAARLIGTLICVCLGLTFSFSTQAQTPSLTKNYGIGLQGATPAFGGISFRYNGLAPVYLQTVGRLFSIIRIATIC